MKKFLYVCIAMMSMSTFAMDSKIVAAASAQCSSEMKKITPAKARKMDLAVVGYLCDHHYGSNNCWASWNPSDADVMPASLRVFLDAHKREK